MVDHPVVHSRRLLDSAPQPPVDGTVDSDVVVILAALLCTLICLVGLGFMARCAWRCRFLRRSGDVPAGVDPSANKGLKKKAIRALPIVVFNSDSGKSTDCAICLTEFLAGESIRVLPLCAHCFHPSCIDTWLSSHSSCPSCRHILADKPLPLPQPQPQPQSARCQRCGLLPENPSSSPISGRSGASASGCVVHDHGVSSSSREPDPDRFLP